jgi:hypothetical protein
MYERAAAVEGGGGLVRPVPEGPQPQLLGDVGQLAVPSTLRRRAQTSYNDFGTH